MVSHQAHNLETVGSIPAFASNTCLDSSGVERLLYTERVRGSKPCQGTKGNAGLV